MNNDTIVARPAHGRRVEVASTRHADPGRGLLAVHRRLVARIAHRGAAGRRSGPSARRHAVAAAGFVAAAGLLWGALIGALAGAIVGFTFYGIGAFYGFFVGGAVGFAVAVPATVVLVGLLVMRHRRGPAVDAVVNTVGNLFAVLAELVLLAAVVAGGATVGWALLHPDPETAHVVFAVTGVGLLGLAWATVVALLRSALRSIVGLWLVFVPPSEPDRHPC